MGGILIKNEGKGLREGLLFKKPSPLKVCAYALRDIKEEALREKAYREKERSHS